MEELEKLAVELQRALIATEHSTGKARRKFEIPIYKMARLTIRMAPDPNHQRPHLHVDFGKERHAASIALDTAEVLAGNLPKKEEKIIRRWVQHHSETLNRIWVTLHAGQNPQGHIVELRGDAE